jgi:TPP-dependent pyruvate/acetoin dehydrogenase alpha subunit
VSEAAAPAAEQAGMPAGVQAGDQAGVQPPPAGALRDWLEQMLVIRQFEAESVRLSLAGHIPGGIHSSAGQEGVAVGTAQALGPDDVVSGTHRSHHHALAKGLTPREVMAELFGKADGAAACTWSTPGATSSARTGSWARASGSPWARPWP